MVDMFSVLASSSCAHVPLWQDDQIDALKRELARVTRNVRRREHYAEERALVRSTTVDDNHLSALERE
eukprot:14280205-Alexandrium_andersonii.AAC.1